jgi:hypothetical protein
MLARTLTVLLLSLAFASPILAQDQPRRDPRPGPTPARPANIDADRLAALIEELITLQRQPKPVAPQPATTPQVRVFTLRAADSVELAKTLNDLYQGDAGRKFRLAVHQSTNSLLILGLPEDIEMIEAVITRLDMLTAERKKAQGM